MIKKITNKKKMNTKICFYCLFCLQVKTSSVNNRRKGIGSVSIHVQVIVYLSLYDLHKCTFRYI